MDDVDIAPDDDGDIYYTPNTARVDEEETSITPTSTSGLKQQVLRNKLDSLYHHLGTKGSLDFVNLDRFKMKQILKQVLLICYGITARIGYL